MEVIMDFETFDGLMKVYDKLIDAGNELISSGFAIESRHVTNVNKQAEKIIELLNKNLGLEKDSAGYTTIDWYIENKISDDPDLHRITAGGREYMIYSNADLYNFITKVELK